MKFLRQIQNLGDENPEEKRVEVQYMSSDSKISFRLYYYLNKAHAFLLCNLYVDENAREMGLANKTLLYILNEAKLWDKKALYLWVIKDSWMRKWYERKGFIYVEDKDDTNVWMKLDIV